MRPGKIFAFLLILVPLAFAGCSKNYWRAKAYMLKAEDAYSHAYALKYKEQKKEERLERYSEACEYFWRVYQHDPDLFTLNRIQSAAESCMWVKDFASAEKFRLFEELYIKRHPTEAEYGDAVPIMSFE